MFPRRIVDQIIMYPVIKYTVPAGKQSFWQYCSRYKLWFLFVKPESLEYSGSPGFATEGIKVR